MEDSGSLGQRTGWLAQHAIIKDDEAIAAIIPMYIKQNSYGEYVFDHAWADALARIGGNYYPKLQIAVPFSPVSGPRLLRGPDSTITITDLANTLTNLCRTQNMSSIHVTFCLAEEASALQHAGWIERHDIQFHWHNHGYKAFDDFLTTLSSSHRKNIRRERRDVLAAGLTFYTLSGDDIKSRHWDAFYEFYLTTLERKWGSAYLTRDFFTLLSQRMGNQVVLMLAEHDGRYVAGALNLRSSTRLYGRNWGCIGNWPFLHFELCYYRAIDYAIEHGLKVVEAGAQGTHKIQRGYVPTTTYSAHWIAHDGLSKAVRHFVDNERIAVDEHMAALETRTPFKHSCE
jgi:predicted N-acyltransferase